MKETFYFSHDYNSRNDPKMQKLLMECKQEGIGIFWCLVEMLYEQGGKLRLDQLDIYSFELRINTDVLQKVITICFEKDDVFFWNKSVKKRLQKRDEKSQKAKESIAKRWNKQPRIDTNVLRKDKNVLGKEYDPNTIKESKVKESKGKERKEREKDKEKKMTLSQLTEEDFQLIADTYNVPLVFVKSKYDDLQNYCQSKGKTYRDYKAALRNWVKADAIKLLQQSKGDPHRQNIDASNIT